MRAPEHSQATVDSCRRVQSEPDLPLSAGLRHSARVEKPTVIVVFCASATVPSLLSAQESHKSFLFAAPTWLASK